MRRIHIVGRKNHGKTTLVLRLVGELSRLGYQVGTIKHTHHCHDLDTPGSDSYRHREAGAGPAAIIAGDLIGVFLSVVPDANAYERLEPLYGNRDIILVEGDLNAKDPKIEVWRSAAGASPLAAERSDIALVVTDDPMPIDVPTVRLDRLADILERIWVLTAVSGEEHAAGLLAQGPEDPARLGVEFAPESPCAKG